jgi:hypothetical protein
MDEEIKSIENIAFFNILVIFLELPLFFICVGYLFLISILKK